MPVSMPAHARLGENSRKFAAARLSGVASTRLIDSIEMHRQDRIAFNDLLERKVSMTRFLLTATQSVPR